MLASKGLFGLLVVVVGAACSGPTNPDAGTMPPDASAPVPAITDPGKPMGPPLTKSIDSTGGTLTSADGRLTMTVPANAVTKATDFSIQPVTSPAPGAIGASYELEPHGVDFGAPVTLSFNAPEAGVSRTSIEGLGIALRDDSGHWTWLSEIQRDASKKVLSGTTTHFCQTSVVEGIQLRPLASTVKEGSSLSLEIAYCVREDDTNGLSGLVYTCDSALAPPVDITDWAVNDTIGGDSTNGTITGSGQSGVYTAPGTKPNPSAVRARVHLGPKGKRGEAWAFSSLSIGEPATYYGIVEIRTSGPFELTARGDTMKVTPHVMTNGELDDGTDMTRFDVSGAIKIDPNTITMGEATCTAKDPVSYLNNNTTNLKKDPVSQLWNLEVKWDLTCQVSGQSMDTSLYLQWTTGCVPDTTNYVPLADPNALTASYTRSSVWCSAAVGEVTVSWNFQQH